MYGLDLSESRQSLFSGSCDDNEFLDSAAGAEYRYRLSSCNSLENDSAPSVTVQRPAFIFLSIRVQRGGTSGLRIASHSSVTFPP